MKTSPTWKTAPISCTCEVAMSYKVTHERGIEVESMCDKPATHAYPARGGGFMALCARHAQKHLHFGGAIPTDELIKRGETWA